MAGGLSGKRILITRAREQAEKTAALIRERGAEPVTMPTIEIHDPDDPRAVVDAIARGHEYAWIAFTSANGVERACAAMDAAGLDATAFGGARLAAIGPGTADALARRSLRADVVALERRGEGLATAMLAAMTPGDTVLLLRAQVARDALPEALRAAGHTVDVVAVYETRAASGDDVERVASELASGAIDAVTFTSASTVDHFVSLVGGGERARTLLAESMVASIGPLTSAALAAHGLRVDVTARESTLPGLLDALDEALPPATPDTPVPVD